ncbi:hypothetical protein BZG36_01815 [Bifiguratus adelaidae]|uniref:Dicer-like protein 1 n=1 Tax=Bifiguratus adelaidae TaxID=1938954 RepID=A0A261Y295_9FUNG|nr:hypothetical protein BZG36_01815 [Bifiguratus adelaidae]
MSESKEGSPITTMGSDVEMASPASTPVKRRNQACEQYEADKENNLAIEIAIQKDMLISKKAKTHHKGAPSATISNSSVIFKNGKFIFSEKRLSFDNHPAVMRGILQFHQYLSTRDTDTGAIPQDLYYLIGLLVQDREETLGSLVKKVLDKLYPASMEDDSDEETEKKQVIPTEVIKQTILNVAQPVNYGVPLHVIQEVDSSHDEIPKASMTTSFGFETLSTEYPNDIQEKIKRRRDKRVQMTAEATDLFVSLSADNQQLVLKAGPKKPSSMSLKFVQAEPAAMSDPRQRKGEKVKENEAKRIAREKQAADRQREKERKQAEKLAEKTAKEAERAAEKAAKEAAREAERRAKALTKEEEAAKKAEEERKKDAAQLNLGMFFRKVTEPLPSRPAAAKKDVEEAKGYRDYFLPFVVKDNMSFAQVSQSSNVLSPSFDDILRDSTATTSDIENLRTEFKQRLPCHLCRKRGRIPTTSLSRIFASDNQISKTMSSDGSPNVQRLLGEFGIRMKLLQFHENVRPPYYGTWTKQSKHIRPKAPLSRDDSLLNYEYDSEAEWEDEGEGEELRSDNEDDEDIGSEADQEEDDFLVPEGYLSADEEMGSDEDSRPVADKTLNTDKDREKVKRGPIKRVIVGPIWNLDPVSADVDLLKGFKVMSLTDDDSIPYDPYTPIPPKFRDSTPDTETKPVDAACSPVANKKTFPDEYLTFLVETVHNSQLSIVKLIEETKQKYPSVAKAHVENRIKEIAKKEKRGSDTKPTWYVDPKVLESVGKAPHPPLNELRNMRLDAFAVVDVVFLSFVLSADNDLPDQGKRSSDNSAEGSGTDSDSQTVPGTGVSEPVVQALNAPNARRYQVELFEMAKKENVIAVLDTGSGKTLIAILLIKAVRVRKALRSNGLSKLSMFLVDRVPLVFQQSKMIRMNCDARVKPLCGEMGVDYWTQTQWTKIKDENEVLVMTAQILLNMLRHGYLQLKDIDLLIFDECHHTHGKHSYHLIMREFYDRCPAEEAPKIFGMTASPQKALHSTIFTVDTAELKRYINAPTEHTVEYSRSPLYQLTPLYVAIHGLYRSSPLLEKAFQATHYCLEQLGPWSADKLWKLIVDRLKKKTAFTLFEDAADLLTAEGQAIIPELQKLVDAFHPPDPRPLQDSRHQAFSPKLVKLIQILQLCARDPDRFRGIIFVERRYTAVVLQALIEEVQELKDLRSAVLTGHGSPDKSDVQMGFRTQTEAITKFRVGEYNLLIATNVAEEGLDIQRCNIVIRFDFFRSLIGYIQSRGRARMPKSKYILMLQRDDPKQKGLLRELRKQEQDMKLWCNALPEKRKASLAMADNDDDLLDADDDDDIFYASNIYIIPSTGALVSLDSAIPLVHYYCAALPNDGFFANKPDFLQKQDLHGYVYTLTLPSNSPVHKFVGDYARTKTLAKQVCALKACIELHKHGVLNDHLLPDGIDPTKEIDDLEEELDDEGLVIGSRRRRGVYTTKLPQLWLDACQVKTTDDEDSRNYYLSVLKLEAGDVLDCNLYQPIGIITEQGLPQLPFLNLVIDGKQQNLSVDGRYAMSLTRAQSELLSEYTLKLVTMVTNRRFRLGTSCPAYRYAILSSHFQEGDIAEEASSDVLDWEAMKGYVHHKPAVVNAEDIKSVHRLLNETIMDYSDNLRTYYVRQVRFDMNPSCQVVSTMDREKDCETYAEYYETLLHRKICNMKQPLLQVEKTSRVLNFLQSPGTLTVKRQRYPASYLIPELVREFGVKASLHRMAMFLPSAMFRLDSLLLIKEVKERLGIEVDDFDLLQAFTTPSANMPFNYERFELLGDSFLKMSTTIQLYIREPTKHEGQLHAARIRIICNRNLYQRARKLELYNYLTSKPLSRQGWRIPGLTLPEDTDAKRQEAETHKLADKTLADVIEATLGAAFNSGGLEKALEAAIALGLPFANIKSWSDFAIALAQEEAQRTPVQPLLAEKHVDIDRIEELCGYKFKDRMLVEEAMTHASWPGGRCYQRLEFLGDAVLDFCTIRRYFYKHLNCSPGQITDLKDASVSNAFLGAVCYKLKLFMHIKHLSQPLLGALTEWCEKYELLDWNNLPAGEFWMNPVYEPPKAVADVVESLLGAIFVDSDFDFAVADDTYQRWCVPLLDAHVGFKTLYLHPVKQLTHDVQRNGCDGLRLLHETDEVEGDNNCRADRAQCDIYLHEERIGSGKGYTVKDARRSAAVVANQWVKDHPDYYIHNCTCQRDRIAVDVDDSDTKDGDKPKQIVLDMSLEVPRMLGVV